MATDPVCGMYVDEGSHLTAVVRGRKYFFCSETCLEAFTAPAKELGRLKRLTALSLGIGLPLFVVGFGQSVGWWLAGLEEPMNLVFFLLATPVQFIAGGRFYRGFLDSIRNRSANMDVLIAIGTTAAWGYSTIVTFLPLLGVPLADKGTYFDTAAVIIGLILLGKYFEELARGKAGDAIRKLMDLAPRTAHVLRDGREDEIPVEMVQVDDLLLVRLLTASFSWPRASPQAPSSSSYRPSSCALRCRSSSSSTCRSSSCARCRSSSDSGQPVSVRVWNTRP